MAALKKAKKKRMREIVTEIRLRHNLKKRTWTTNAEKIKEIIKVV
jgi:hypothetical protein